MTTEVLLVEDDENYVNELRTILEGIGVPFQLTVARSRDEA